MKILLVELPIDNWNRFGRHYLPNPGTLAVGTYLKHHGYDVKIIDTYAQGMGWNALRDILKREQPDMVGSSSYTVDIYGRSLLARLIKEINLGIVTVLGGVHASLVPEETLRLARAVDYIVIGEGEETFLELVQNLAAGRDKRQMGSVKGLAFMLDDKYVRTAPRSLISNLDKLPLPDYSLLPMDRYRNVYFPGPPQAGFCFYTSRGCTSRCAFCSETVLWEHRWRGRSAGKIVEEFSILNRRFAKKFFLLNDDNFLFDRQRNEQFVEAMARSRLRIEFRAGVRVDTLLRDKDLLPDLRRVGLTALQVGVEHFDQRVLDGMKKGYRSDQFEQALQVIRQARIPFPRYFFIVGNADDNEQTMNKIISQSKRYGLGVIQISNLTPWPGTPLFQELSRAGKIKRKDYRRYDFKNVIAPTEYLNMRQVTLLRMSLFYRWYFNIKILLRNWPNRYLRHFHLQLLTSMYVTSLCYILANKWKLWRLSWYNRRIHEIFQEHMKMSVTEESHVQ